MICSRCGKDLQSDFIFCPSCGRAVDGISSFDAVLDSSFSRISAGEAALSAERLAKMDEDLRELENELDELALGGQRIRRQRR